MMAGGDALRTPLKANCRDQTEGNPGCTVAASLHPRSRPPSSPAGDAHVLQSFFAFPTHCLHHSFLSLSSPRLSLLSVLPIPPTVFSSHTRFPLSVEEEKKEKKKPHTRACVAYPPAHAVGAALSLHKAAQFDAWLCKEMLKSVRYHCVMVSPWQLREQSPAMLCQPQRILNLSKEKSWIWSIKHFIL